MESHAACPGYLWYMRETFPLKKIMIFFQSSFTSVDFSIGYTADDLWKTGFESNRGLNVSVWRQRPRESRTNILPAIFVRAS